jgi:hypothetical protein
LFLMRCGAVNSKDDRMAVEIRSGRATALRKAPPEG